MPRSLKSGILKARKNFVNVLTVLTKRPGGENQDIVEVCGNEFIKERTEDPIDVFLKRTRCVNKTKRGDQPFVQAISGTEAVNHSEPGEMRSL